MIKKITIFGLVMLGFVAIVLAQGGVQEGDIITQAQLDSIDAETFNLQCQLEDIGQSHVIEFQGDWYYFRNVSCLSLDPLSIDNPSDGYIITRPNHLPSFLISDYFTCKQQNAAEFCNDFYTEVLVDYHQSIKITIRKRIAQFQTVEGNDEDTDYEDGFGL